MFKRIWRLTALLSMSALLLSNGCISTLFDWKKIQQAVIVDNLFG